MGNAAKILIITDTFAGMAGSERNISQLLAGIDRQQFEILLACITSGELAQKAHESGTTVVNLGKGGIYTAHGIKNIAALRRLIRERQVSLLLTYHETSDFYGLILSRLCGIPVITSRRDMGFKTGMHHRLAYRMLGRLFDSTITVCDTVGREMARLGWFAPQMIVTIYNGVDLKAYDSVDIDKVRLKTALGITTGLPVVGLIANFRKIKGIDHFITAAAHLHRQGIDAEYVIIGGDTHVPGETIEDMRELAGRLGVAGLVHFLGRRTDIPEMIALFDIAVVASLTEGFSNSILEFMAASKPVVATTVGGNAEAVVHGETGLLVPPGDSSALAAAIQSLLTNQAEARRMGAAARARAEKVFSLPVMLGSYERLFHQAIGSRRRNKTRNPHAEPAAARHREQAD